MAWNPNVPTITNRVQDDLDAIRENFQHLDRLAERIDELQTVSELAPIANDLQAVSGLASVVEKLQAVSELASVAGELQAVRGLAPYVQALLDSRIVDHNLDVPNPPNGRYIRWANGLQLTMQNVTANVSITTTWLYGGYIARITPAGVYPAAFSEVYARQVSLTSEHAVSIQFYSALTGLTEFSLQVRSITQQTNATIKADVITIGRWK